MSRRQIDRLYTRAIESMAACLHANEVAPWSRYVANANWQQAIAIGFASRPYPTRRKRAATQSLRETTNAV